MDTKNGNNNTSSNTTTDLMKPTLSSTKSIDEGFESDPDRELSSTDSETGNNLLIIEQAPNCHDFDVLQRTDRDGVQHTQITRRNEKDYVLESTGTLSTNHLRRMKASIASGESSVKSRSTQNLYPSIIAKPKVTIPRAGQRIPPTNTSQFSTSNTAAAATTPNYSKYKNSNTKSNQSHLVASGSSGGSISSNSRISSKSGILLPNHHSEQSINPRSLIIDPIRPRDSQRNDLLMGKLVCISSPHQQANLTTRPFYNASNQSKSKQYPSTNSIAYNSLLENPHSMHTFYPAEGDISIYPSQYGLKYKSTHSNGRQEQRAPITMWTQSIPRQTRR